MASRKPSPEAAELEALRRVNRAMDEAVQNYVSALAHDLKNPLAAIQMGVQGTRRLLDRGPVQPQQVAERLTRIEHSLDQIKELIARARGEVDSGGSAASLFEPQMADLVDVVKALVEEFRKLTGAHRIELGCEHAQLPCKLDPAGFRRALHNVVDNALKFSERDTIVRLTLAREADCLAVHCNDQGIGIPAADLPYIGQRFYRGENVLGRYKGAGIGLFEAKRVLTNHGGDLTFTSKEGSGSTFTLRLPG